MQRLSKILAGINILNSPCDLDVKISGICFDSRRVQANNLFVAVRGTITDGHKYISSVIEMGASVVICEEIPADSPENICFIKVADSAEALALISSGYYDNPSSKLKLVGVTGTNGKTTIASLLYDMFQKLGYKSGLLSTVGNKVFNKAYSASHTTPDPVQINQILSEMVLAGCEYAFMEVSSIALDQHRTDGLAFDGGIFTNLSHDHLDYHGDFDNYLAAKKKFFDMLDGSAFALVNSDDRRGKIMTQNCKGKIHTYALKSGAEYKCRIIEERFEGMLLNIDGVEVSTSFIGDFNAYNLLAVYASTVLLGAEKDEALTTLSSMVPVDGRLEIIRDNDGRIAVVDYAHTPDALDNVLDALNRIKDGNESIITVVGAGGDRDKTKRPMMAAIAAQNSSKVILTSDNPRSEDPEGIISDMMAGVPADYIRSVLKVSDRAEAIKTALMIAGEKDIVLVAGKGHETYQEIKGVKSHFDDREEIRKYFNINKSM